MIGCNQQEQTGRTQSSYVLELATNEVTYQESIKVCDYFYGAQQATTEVQDALIELCNSTEQNPNQLNCWISIPNPISTSPLDAYQAAYYNPTTGTITKIQNYEELNSVTSLPVCQYNIR